MATFPEDIYTEPEPDPDTLANLGPLRALAGVWQSEGGATVHPVADGDEHQALRRTLRSPADRPADQRAPAPLRPALPHPHRQARGGRDLPRPGGLLAVGAGRRQGHADHLDPRGQTALLGGTAGADDRSFELVAWRGDPIYGICSGPFLEHAFRTDEIRVRVTVNGDGTWTYDEDTVMEVRGRPELVHHTDRNTLTLVEPPTPQPAGPGRSAKGCCRRRRRRGGGRGRVVGVVAGGAAWSRCAPRRRPWRPGPTARCSGAGPSRRRPPPRPGAR